MFEMDGDKNTKIPIAYVIDNFYRGGGTENQLAVLIDNIDRNRFTPYVFNLKPKWTDTEIDIDCDVYYLNVGSLLSLNTFKAISRIASFLKENKVKILQVYFVESRLIGTIAGKLAGMKKIVFCRREMGWWYTPMKLRLFRILARMAHYCLVNAHAIKELVAATEKFPASKIEVVHNGVELKRRGEGKPKERSDFGIPDFAPVVVMVANLRPVKRIDRLIRCAAAMKNDRVHFLVVGDGPLLDDLKVQAESLNIGERFHFYHAKEGVYDILQMSDVGVLTSESEGLSNVLIEYAFAGLPTVAFDSGGNREVVDDGRSGFIIADNDVKLMAAKIDFLFEDVELYRKMGAAAREHAENNFGVASMVKKTEDFYLKILEE